MIQLVTVVEPLPSPGVARQIELVRVHFKFLVREFLLLISAKTGKLRSEGNCSFS